MSSATTEYIESNITSLFISFCWKWTLKAKELTALSCKKASALHSDLYNIQNIMDLSFCFCLEYQGMNPYCPFEISVKGSKMWSFKLLRPIILIKEKAYCIRPFNEHIFLESLDESCYSNEENVEIHCVINICPVDAGPLVKDEPSSLDCQKTVGIESLSYTPLPKDYTNPYVISFTQKGEFPELTVDMAIQIISEAETHKCDVLKIICIEYLIYNITAQCIQKILKAAIEFDLPRLERSCTEKLARGYIRIA